MNNSLILAGARPDVGPPSCRRQQSLTANKCGLERLNQARLKGENPCSFQLRTGLRTVWLHLDKEDRRILDWKIGFSVARGWSEHFLQ